VPAVMWSKQSVEWCMGPLENIPVNIAMCVGLSWIFSAEAECADRVSSTFRILHHPNGASGMWHCGIGQVVSNVSRDCSASTSETGGLNSVTSSW
jgi:hypothetical protein